MPGRFRPRNACAGSASPRRSWPVAIVGIPRNRPAGACVWRLGLSFSCRKHTRRRPVPSTKQFQPRKCAKFGDSQGVGPQRRANNRRANETFLFTTEGKRGIFHFRKAGFPPETQEERKRKMKEKNSINVSAVKSALKSLAGCPSVSADAIAWVAEKAAAAVAECAQRGRRYPSGRLAAPPENAEQAQPGAAETPASPYLDRIEAGQKALEFLRVEVSGIPADAPRRKNPRWQECLAIVKAAGLPVD